MKIELKIYKEGDKWFARGWKNYELIVSGYNLEKLEHSKDYKRWIIFGQEVNGKLLVEKLQGAAPRIKKSVTRHKPIYEESPFNPVGGKCKTKFRMGVGIRTKQFNVDLLKD